MSKYTFAGIQKANMLFRGMYVNGQRKRKPKKFIRSKHSYYKKHLLRQDNIIKIILKNNEQFLYNSISSDIEFYIREYYYNTYFKLIK